MRININPITIDDKVCTQAEVSVAISNSVAIRIVPVDNDGTEYSAESQGIVGDSTQTDIAAFMSAVEAALIALVGGRL